MRTLSPNPRYRPSKQIEPGKGLLLMAGATLAWLFVALVGHGFWLLVQMVSV
jgi:hypothetical protein